MTPPLLGSFPARCNEGEIMALTIISEPDLRKRQSLEAARAGNGQFPIRAIR